MNVHIQGQEHLGEKMRHEGFSTSEGNENHADKGNEEEGVRTESDSDDSLTPYEMQEKADDGLCHPKRNQ